MESRSAKGSIWESDNFGSLQMRSRIWLLRTTNMVGLLSPLSIQDSSLKSSIWELAFYWPPGPFRYCLKINRQGRRQITADCKGISDAKRQIRALGQLQYSHNHHPVHSFSAIRQAGEADADSLTFSRSGAGKQIAAFCSRWRARGLLSML